MIWIKVLYYTTGETYELIQKNLKKMEEKFKTTLSPNISVTSLYYYDIVDKKSNNSYELTDTLKNIIFQNEHKTQFDTLVIPHLGVLGANLDDIRRITSILKKKNITLIPIDDDLFLISSNSSETLFINQSMKNRVPYGYYIKNRKIICDYSANIVNQMPLYKRKPGNIVQWIFKNFIDCKSYAELAKMLNKKKVPSPKDTISKKNGKVNSLSSWNRQHVKNILTNNFYLGERLKAKNYLNLVNEDLWYDVQEIVQEIQRL